MDELEITTDSSNKAELLRVFSARRLRRRVLSVLVVAAGIALLGVVSGKVGGVLGISDSALLIGLASFLGAGFVVQGIDWRCPKCKEYLGNGSNPKSCGRCGMEFQPTQDLRLTH